MEFLIFSSFFAGVLTVLAPCVLPILPLILGGGIASDSRSRPFLILVGLGISIFVFTFALKVSVAFIDIPTSFWNIFSGLVMLFFGITLLFPVFWERVSSFIHLSSTSQNLMNTAISKKGYWGSLFLGASLGPVFSSCSPTYLLILGTVLPQNFFLGSFYLLVYILGLLLVLFFIILGGRALVKKMKWAANPNGIFKKTIGILLLLFAFFLITGYIKDIGTWLLLQPWFPNTAEVEIVFFS